MYSSLIITHLIAATIWTGGHIILSVCILPYALKHRDIIQLTFFEGVYEKIGMPALLIQVATGLLLIKQYWPLDLAILSLQEPIQKLFWLKLALLATTIGFALHARLKVIPNLSSKNLICLALHVVPVTIISIAFALSGVGFRLGWFS